MRQATCLGLDGETGVTDDTQHVTRIAVIPIHHLFVVGGQHHFRATTLALSCSMGIQSLCRKILRLGNDIVVEIWQYGRIETDVILNQQYHLDTSLLDIMLNVHAVLYQFDNGKDEVGIAQPAEHIVEDRHVFVLNALGNTMREGSQHDTRNMGSRLLDITGHSKSIVIGITRHTDDEVNVGSLQHLFCLLGGTHLRKRRRVTQSQLHILIEKFLVDTPVILQHEGIIGISNYQDIKDASRHQIDKRDIFKIKLVPFLGYFTCFFHIS